MGYAVGTESYLMHVTGESMEPTLSHGDVLICIEDEISVGDIAAYDSDTFDVPVVHRVIGVEDYGNETIYRFRGDNNRFDDPPVPEENIRCRVVSAM